MSQPVTKRHDFDDATEAELERWPGVTFRRECAAKHFRLILTFDGNERCVIYSASPSDTRRGALNHVTTIRKELRGMGAVRTPPPKSLRTRVYRPKPQPPKLRIVSDTGNPAQGPRRDPWEALAGVRVLGPAPDEAPVQRGFWAWIKRLFG